MNQSRRRSHLGRSLMDGPRMDGPHLSWFAAVASIVALALSAAAPGWAYRVFLKDGTEIVTEEKYRVEGEMAILTLPGGTQASYLASEIDVAKTEEFNKIDYGTAKVIEGNQARTVATDELLNDKETLSDLLARRKQGLALPEQSVRPDRLAPTVGGADGEEARDAPMTKAGFIDLFSMPREPYPKPTIMSEVMRYLKGQGVDNVRLYRGSRLDRPLVEIVAASEASVFKAMKDSANSLVQIHERFPEDVAAFELLLLTDNQVRAGQFTLTPELANMLATEEMDPASFFLRYVEF